VKCAGSGYKNHRKGESIDKTVRRLYGNNYPDWVLVMPTGIIEGKQKLGKSKNRPYKVVAILNDLHGSIVLNIPRGNLGSLARKINSMNFDALLMMYTMVGGCQPKYGFDYFLKTLKPAKLHTPPWVEPRVLEPSIKRDIDVSFIATVVKGVYPLRCNIHNNLRKLAKQNKWKIIVRGKRPEGRRRVIADMLKKGGYIVGSKYINTLKRSKVFIFGNSRFKYPLKRIVEGWSCGTLVVCDKPLTSARMGMASGVSYVEINKGSWKEKLKYYIDNKSERDKISENGYNTYIEKHTTDIRAKEIIKFLETR